MVIGRLHLVSVSREDILYAVSKPRKFPRVRFSREPSESGQAWIPMQ